MIEHEVKKFEEPKLAAEQLLVRLTAFAPRFSKLKKITAKARAEHEQMVTEARELASFARRNLGSDGTVAANRTYEALYRFARGADSTIQLPLNGTGTATLVVNMDALANTSVREMLAGELATAISNLGELLEEIGASIDRVRARHAHHDSEMRKLLAEQPAFRTIVDAYRASLADPVLQPLGRLVDAAYVTLAEALGAYQRAGMYSGATAVTLTATELTELLDEVLGPIGTPAPRAA